MNFVKQFSLSLPLVIAPMGGGPTTPALVSACCNAGTLGSLAGAYLSPQEIERHAAETRAQTTKAFAINLFVPARQVTVSDAELKRAIAVTKPFRDTLGLSEPFLKAPYHQDFEPQFEAMLKANPAVFSYVFGTLPRTFLQECRKRGILTMGTATNLEEAAILQEAHVDYVVAQGLEAGAHRGMFEDRSEDSDINTIALCQQIMAQLKLPVIAAGGLMTGQDIAAALQAGAQAAMMGTAFLTCPEAGTSTPYRQALQQAQSAQPSRALTFKPPRLTRAFSGRWARGLPNEFMEALDSQPDAILPFPAQNAFTRDLRTRAAALGQTNVLSLWAGKGVQKLRYGLPAAELIQQLTAEFHLATTAG